MDVNKYSKFIKDSKDSDEYWIQTSITDFTEEVSMKMEENNLSRRDLAEKLGTSQAYITKVLRGNVNFTLASMTKIARALNTIVRIHLAPEDKVVKWEDCDAGVVTTEVDTIAPQSVAVFVMKSESKNIYHHNFN